MQILPSAEAAATSDRVYYKHPRTIYEAAAYAASDARDAKNHWTGVAQGIFGQPEPTTHQDLLGGGAVVFLQKPVRRTELRRALLRLLTTPTQQRPQAAAVSPLPAVRANRGLRVLVAEDNAINQEVAIEMLSTAGFESVVASNGEQALDLLATHPPDHFAAVLMDCQMPELDGYSAATEIRRREAMGTDDRTDADPGIPDEVTVPIEPVIDLHAFSPSDVRSVVESYLEAALEAGFQEVRLVHGRGIGVQREIVRALLARHPDVVSFGDAPPERGGWGATLARLRPRTG